MSQQGMLTDSTSSSSDIETLTGDTGGAVGPDGAFNINILGGAGITVNGNPGTNTLTIVEDEVVEGTGQTIGAVTDDILTIALGGTAGTYTLEARVSAFEASNPAYGGMWALGVVGTDGAAASLVNTDTENQSTTAPIAAVMVDWVVSANNAILRATGVAGLTVEWAATAEYVVAS